MSDKFPRQFSMQGILARAFTIIARHDLQNDTAWLKYSAFSQGTDNMAQEPSLSSTARGTTTLARAFFAALDALPEPPRPPAAQTAFEAFSHALHAAPEPRRQAVAAPVVKEDAPTRPVRAPRPPAKAEKKAAPVKRARKARTPRKGSAAQQAQTGNGTAAAA